MNKDEKKDMEKIKKVRRAVISALCFVIMCAVTFVLSDMQNKKAHRAGIGQNMTAADQANK